MNKIIVSYNSKHDVGGYHTTQNIKISKDMLDDFNYYLKHYLKSIEEKQDKTSWDMRILLYGKPIINLKRCLTITQLRLLYMFLKGKGFNTDRIKLDRNTMIIIC